MNQIARSLAWIRDALILTTVETPRDLDESGGVKPVFEIGQGGEPYADWRPIEFVADPASVPAAGLSVIPGLPDNVTEHALKTEQLVLAAMSFTYFTGAAHDFRVYAIPPGSSAEGVMLTAYTGAAAAVRSGSHVGLFGTTRRIVLPPGWGIAIYNVSLYGVGDLGAFAFMLGRIPAGFGHHP